MAPGSLHLVNLLATASYKYNVANFNQTNDYLFSFRACIEKKISSVYEGFYTFDTGNLHPNNNDNPLPARTQGILGIPMKISKSKKIQNFLTFCGAAPFLLNLRFETFS